MDRHGSLDAAVDDLAARLALAERFEREAVALECGVGAAGEAPPRGGVPDLDVAAQLVDPLGEHVQLPAGPGIEVAHLRHDARAEHGHPARGGAAELGRCAASAAAEPLADVHDRRRPLLGAVHHHDRPELARRPPRRSGSAGSPWRGCRRGGARTARRPRTRSATRATRRGARPAPPRASRSRVRGLVAQSSASRASFASRSPATIATCRIPASASQSSACPISGRFATGSSAGGGRVPAAGPQRRSSARAAAGSRARTTALEGFTPSNARARADLSPRVHEWGRTSDQVGRSPDFQPS